MNLSSILTGFTDLEIYPLLKEKIPLYIHDSIHLKLIVDLNSAFLMTSNITQSGLGFIDQSNIEVGTEIELNRNDWRHIYKILYESRQVTDHLYEEYINYREKNKKLINPLPKLIINKELKKGFSILDLPITNNPCLLFNYLIQKDVKSVDMHDVHHDEMIFTIDENIKKSKMI